MLFYQHCSLILLLRNLDAISPTIKFLHGAKHIYKNQSASEAIVIQLLVLLLGGLGSFLLLFTILSTQYLLFLAKVKIFL